MSDLVSVQYTGKNMVPLGGTMILSGEVRQNVPLYQVREALRHNPGKFLILDADVIQGEPVPDGAVIVDRDGNIVEVRGHSHEHVEVTTNAEPEFLAVQAEPQSDEPVTVLSEESHVDQPEQPSKPPAKRRSRKK